MQIGGYQGQWGGRTAEQLPRGYRVAFRDNEMIWNSAQVVAQHTKCHRVFHFKAGWCNMNLNSIKNNNVINPRGLREDYVRWSLQGAY